MTCHGRNHEVPLFLFENHMCCFRCTSHPRSVRYSFQSSASGCHSEFSNSLFVSPNIQNPHTPCGDSLRYNLFKRFTILCSMVGAGPPPPPPAICKTMERRAMMAFNVFILLFLHFNFGSGLNCLRQTNPSLAATTASRFVR